MDMKSKSRLLANSRFLCASLFFLGYLQLVSADESAVSLEIPVESPDGAQGMHHTVLLPPEAVAERNSLTKSIGEKGYIKKLDAIPRAEYVMARMREREEMAKLGNLEKDSKILGFSDITSQTVSVDKKLPSEPTLMPNRYKRSESKSYLMQGGHKLKQLHTNTQFGTLIIDEMRNVAGASVDEPNIKIAGKPAKIAHIKYKGNKWATVVFAPYKDQVFIVEADKRLKADEQKMFVKMVEELITDREKLLGKSSD